MSKLRSFTLALIICISSMPVVMAQQPITASATSPLPASGGRSVATIIGTWTHNAPFNGKNYTFYMHLDSRGNYRYWAAGVDGSSSGNYTIEGEMLYITKSDGVQMSTHFFFNGPDTLFFQKEDGTQQVWHRTSADVKAPGEGTSGQGMSSADQNNAQKCFDEGARLYNDGDMADAFYWFKRAAEMGNIEAQLQTGWHYESGVGVGQDYNAAAYWYRKAAEGGEPDGMKHLGTLYENGTGVPEDWMEAARWYGKSAERHCANGECALAEAYRYGIGVPQTRALAIDWYRRAAADGRSDATDQADWLSDPTNFVGFMDDSEYELVIGDRLECSAAFFGGDPAGITFRNHAERRAWLVQFARMANRRRSRDLVPTAGKKNQAKRHAQAVRNKGLVHVQQAVLQENLTH